MEDIIFVDYHSFSSDGVYDFKQFGGAVSTSAAAAGVSSWLGISSTLCAEGRLVARQVVEEDQWVVLDRLYIKSNETHIN